MRISDWSSDVCSSDLNNILSPASGDPIIVPSQDVVLGLYWMSRERVGAKGEGMVFSDVSEVHRAYENGVVDLQAKIKVRLFDYTEEERSEEHTSELQSLMRISYAVFCLKKTSVPANNT